MALHSLIVSEITTWLTGCFFPIPNICFTMFMISSSLCFIKPFKKWALLKSFSMYYMKSSGPEVFG